MKKKLFFCVLSAFLLCGCTNTPTPDPGPGPGPGPDPEPNKYTIIFKNYDDTVLQTLTDVVEGTVPTYTGSTPTKPEDDDYIYTFANWTPAVVAAYSNAVYTATYSSTEKSKVTDLGKKTIAEVREVCEKLTDLNEAGIAVDMTTKVTITGVAMYKFSTEKTAKPYNLSDCYKTIFGDSTGYIGCASPKSSDGNTLWGKVANYAGKTNKYYEVTGYISMYMNQPELYVPGKTYTMFDNDGSVNFDVEAYSSGKIDLDGFYEEACATKYNMAGFGYGKFCTVEGVKCVDKRDTVYMFTDGDSVMKVVAGNISGFTIGQNYDITGYVSLLNWIPSFYAFSAKTSVKTVENLSKDDATSITVADFRKFQSSQKDSTSNFSSYINLFKNVYVSNVYATAICQSGNYYVCVRDTFYAGKEYITGHGVGQTQYGMIEISNDNYWNCTLDEIAKFCPIADYFDQEESFDFYYSPFLQEYYDKKPVWRVFAYNELILAE